MKRLQCAFKKLQQIHGEREYTKNYRHHNNLHVQIKPNARHKVGRTINSRYEQRGTFDMLRATQLKAIPPITKALQKATKGTHVNYCWRGEAGF